MPTDILSNLYRQLEGQDSSGPPIHLWNPEFCGDVDIRIDREGRWFHEGTEMKREALVNLFSSVMRKEEDGEYYLVTPVEKCRLQVDCCPVLIIEAECTQENGIQRVYVKTKTGKVFLIGPEHPLEVMDANNGERVPVVQLNHGLEGLLARSVYYQLVDLCEENAEGEYGLMSEGIFYPLNM